MITVTEFEETEVREPSKGPKEAEENGSPQGDESQQISSEMPPAACER